MNNVTAEKNIYIFSAVTLFIVVEVSHEIYIYTNLYNYK